MMYRVFIILFLTLSQLYSLSSLKAQGCVAIRNMGCSSSMTTGNNQAGIAMKGDWVVSLGYTYFKSFRHFRGDTEETHRVEEGTEVINYFHSFDIGVSYGLTDRLTLTAILPININNRSSMYEHYGNSVEANPNRDRFNTRSAGISDFRLSCQYWILDPSKMPLGNLAIGFGIKAPTGNPGVIGEFHKLDQNGVPYTILRPVDQSIQLGDQGWGGSFEFQGYQFLSGNFSLFYNGFYMSNPRNVTTTLRNVGLDPDDPFSYLSTADQFSARVGVFYTPTSRLAFNLGSRVEGIPATDLFGASEGFRRPGYVVSVEPGFSFLNKNYALNFSIPLALYRNRIRSTSDKIRDRHGDAAFADYVVNISVTYLIGSNKRMSHTTE